MRTIRAAIPADGAAMLSLIEAQPSSGNLRIIYTRRPDAYFSYLMENADAELTVYEDANGRLVAQGACLPQKLYINGNVEAAGYITGLHKREGAFFNLFAMAADGFSRSKCETFYCSVLGENNAALQALLKKKYKAFTLAPICDYRTYLLHPSAIKAVKTNASDVYLRKAQKADEADLIAFLQNEGKRFSLFPCIESFDAFCGLSVKDFYLLYKSNEIIACGALWDQRAFKQYIAFAYGGVYQVVEKLGALPHVFRLISLPKIGEAARFAQLAFFTAKDDALHGLRTFLSLFAKEIPKTYEFIAVGATQNGLIDQICSPLRSIRFDSKICAVNPGESILAASMVNPRPECALL